MTVPSPHLTGSAEPENAGPTADANVVVDEHGADKLVVNHVTVEYHTRKGTVHAVSDVSLTVPRGSTLALVGESGCGKSSLGRAMLQLPRPNSGRVMVDDTDLCSLSGAALTRARELHAQQRSAA